MHYIDVWNDIYLIVMSFISKWQDLGLFFFNSLYVSVLIEIF